MEIDPAFFAQRVAQARIRQQSIIRAMPRG